MSVPKIIPDPSDYVKIKKNIFYSRKIVLKLPSSEVIEISSVSYFSLKKYFRLITDYFTISCMYSIHLPVVIYKNIRRF